MNEMTAPMTKGEIQGLGVLIRKQERLLKTATDQRAVELKADFENQISAVYRFDDDEVWREAYRLAEKAIEDAQVVIADRCAELGIPKEFAPSLSCGWFGRGENAVAKRRDELRRKADAEIKAMAQRARGRIEEWSLKTQTQLVAQNLTSDSARAFLDNMPPAEALMPLLDLQQMQTLTKE